MAKLLYWIKKRHNPQTGIYYVPYGQRTKADAKKYESSLYGTNFMLSFKTEGEYNNKIQSLLEAGERVIW